jgi:hypothetical protein
VAVIQSFGQKINFHPHLHLLVTEGGEDPEGRFHHLADFEDNLLAEFFSREVFALLLWQELISETLVEKISGWRCSGLYANAQLSYFHVHIYSIFLCLKQKAGYSYELLH